MKMQSAPVPKTLEEHRDYLYKIVRLKLFFLHKWLTEHPEETFSDVLRNRVDIYRKCNVNPENLNPKTIHFDDPAWMKMENHAETLYRKYPEDRARFEEEAFEVFKGSLDDRCERDFLDESWHAGYQCGSLKHEAAADKNGTMSFHIANVLSPRSIFDDPRYLPECFVSLMDIAEKDFGATRIATGTWLNSNKHWLALFPPEWIENMSDPFTSIQWHYGFWGQFITARKTFNDKYGQILRETGKFPYQLRCSNCSIEAMRKHLNEHFGVH